MSMVTDRISLRTVPRALSLVNSLVPMTTRGERLRAYLLARTGGKRQTISKWTNPAFDRYPDLETLAAIAKALNVPTFEIIAAMDDDVAVSLIDPRTKDAMRSMLEELLAERDQRRPPGMPPGRA